MNQKQFVYILLLVPALVLAGPAHNARPCPIPGLEMLPPNPPPAEPSPAERAAEEAHWRSNAIAHAEERAAMRELAIMLAGKSGMATNDLDLDTTDATATRAAILRAAAGRSRTTAPWPEYGTNAAGFAAEVKRNRK